MFTLKSLIHKDSLEATLSDKKSAEKIEQDFYKVLAYLVKNQAFESFQLTLNFFYSKIVYGEYRPSPASYIINDIFKIAAKSKNFNKFFDILYQENYIPVFDDPKSAKTGELISILLNEQLYKQLNYLIENHHFPKKISTNDGLNHFFQVLYNKDHIKLKKFLSYDIYIYTIDNEIFSYLYSNINDENIEDLLLCSNILKESPLYKKDFTNFKNKSNLSTFQIVFNQTKLNHQNYLSIAKELNITNENIQKSLINAPININKNFFFDKEKTLFFSVLFEKQKLPSLYKKIFIKTIFLPITHSNFTDHIYNYETLKNFQIQFSISISSEINDSVEFKKEINICAKNFIYALRSNFNTEQMTQLLNLLFLKENDFISFLGKNKIKNENLNHFINAFYEKQKINSTFQQQPKNQRKKRL